MTHNKTSVSFHFDSQIYGQQGTLRDISEHIFLKLFYLLRTFATYQCRKIPISLMGKIWKKVRKHH